MGVIQNYLQRRKGSGTVSDSTYNHISEWMEWYRGNVKNGEERYGPGFLWTAGL